MRNVIETWYCTYFCLVQGKDDQKRNLNAYEESEQICFNTFLGPGNNTYSYKLVMRNSSGSETIRDPNTQV